MMRASESILLSRRATTSRLSSFKERRRSSDSSVQQLERVGPFVACESLDAPQHAQRFDSACRFRRAHIGGLPAKLIQDFGHDLLCCFIVAADEHGRSGSGKLRVDETRVADGTEGLDEVGARKLLL